MTRASSSSSGAFRIALTHGDHLAVGRGMPPDLTSGSERRGYCRLGQGRGAEESIPAPLLASAAERRAVRGSAVAVEEAVGGPAQDALAVLVGVPPPMLA